MKLAAIYSRRSTEQSVSDDAKSVTRQVEHARAYAQRKGWTVLDEHVYTDDGISGAEFQKRPGFLKLMASLGKRTPFEVLILSEPSRLGREQIETSYAIKRLADAGVTVYCYLDDKVLSVSTALDKVMLGLTGFASEVERERTRGRTRCGDPCNGVRPSETDRDRDPVRSELTRKPSRIPPAPLPLVCPACVR
jgi:DNA invertase Pin-like site-specific DNA recombinase